METHGVDPRTAKEHLDRLQADGAAAARRSGAPFWYVCLQSLCIAGFVSAFGLGRWEAMGSAVSAVLLVLLGMLRPVITGTRAEPWAYRSSLPAALRQAGLVAAAVLLAMFAVKPADSPGLLGIAVLLSFVSSLVLGLHTERALVRSIAEDT
ncbi:hypothetical protein QMA10_16985 [Arthrobacter sp. APC 3897]|uniref:hypothetical protein n=1 Tax=Arthrobacter sp. APC 3897 TaxID=3035204 RepID=UPI0025B5C023|nr:hypothetical protein [Arthrobacter sp. APC 3897]MDN3483606.1 hypothetical protein [Arthrobacter sp. APC 3897]